MRPRVAIAGSGLAGLACAAALAERAEVTVYERLPVAGGERWEDPRHAKLAGMARASGAHLALGTQAIRWDGRAVLAVGQAGGLGPAGALVVATGHRPLTMAELGIAGPRCGGIVPATVAEHLVGHRVRLGRRPLVVGGGAAALTLAAALAAQGCDAVTLLAPDGPGPAAAPPGVEIHAGARPALVEGEARVSALVAERPGAAPLRLECDALVLAHGRVPYRNVDGAVGPAPGVAFAQPGAEPPDGPAIEAAGHAAAGEALTLAAEPREPFSYSLRTGGPR